MIVVSCKGESHREQNQLQSDQKHNLTNLIVNFATNFSKHLQSGCLVTLFPSHRGNRNV